MRAFDTARLATQSVRRYPLRSGMMLLAIAIGVAAVVALTAVAEGARRYVTSEFSALGTNMLIVLPGKTETAGAGLAGMLVGETARDLTLEDTIAIERIPLITQVAPVIVGAGTASWRSRERDVTVLGTNHAMAAVQHWEMQAGRFLPELDLSIASPVCVIGGVIAREVVNTPRPVGQFLRIGDNRCRIIGVLAEAGLTGAFNTDETVIVPIANARQIFNTNGVFRVLAESRDRDSMGRARRQIIAVVKERHQGVEDITVITQDAVLTTFDSIFNVITLALAGIAAISLLVAGVLIMNVMLVAVSQRTSEIGLLKAIGATQRQIVWMFLAEAVWLSVLGAVIGLGIGMSAAYALETAFPILDFSAPAWASAAAFGVAVGSGMIFGLLPARRAARLDPVHALMRR